MRPAELRQRCGPYTVDGEQNWGDHRVTFPDSTCEDMQCTVAHHPDELPGWAEHMDGFFERPGVRPIAAALYGWNCGGDLVERMGDMTAWNAAHVVLDALRDAGFRIVSPEPPS